MSLRDEDKPRPSCVELPYHERFDHGILTVAGQCCDHVGDVRVKPEDVRGRGQVRGPVRPGVGPSGLGRRQRGVDVADLGLGLLHREHELIGLLGDRPDDLVGIVLNLCDGCGCHGVGSFRDQAQIEHTPISSAKWRTIRVKFMSKLPKQFMYCLDLVNSHKSYFLKNFLSLV